MYGKDSHEKIYIITTLLLISNQKQIILLIGMRYIWNNTEKYTVKNTQTQCTCTGTTVKKIK